MKISQLVCNKKTTFNGPILLKPNLFTDERGFFMESWNNNVFNNILKKPIIFVQDNHSFSHQGVLRGMHYQLNPFPQSKLVRCISGEIFDVIVDLRKSSETYLSWAGIYLNEKNNAQLWVPYGFAHGFLTISKTATVLYKTNAYWDGDSEVSLNWQDKDINIKWPKIEQNIVISEKDKRGKKISEIEKSQLLP